jgi:hypothetical protein
MVKKYVPILKVIINNNLGAVNDSFGGVVVLNVTKDRDLTNFI